MHQDNQKGKFILTSSNNIKNKNMYDVHHSGTGRIARIKMYPIILYELGKSSDKLSLLDIANNNVKEQYLCETDLKKIGQMIISGGWPSYIDLDSKQKQNVLNNLSMKISMNLKIKKEKQPLCQW